MTWDILAAQLVALSHKQLLRYDFPVTALGHESLCTCAEESDPKDIRIWGEESRWKN